MMNKIFSFLLFLFLIPLNFLGQGLDSLPVEINDKGERFYVYEVQAQEGFWSLQRKFKVDEAEIIKANPDAKKGLILGQKLLIPIKESEIPKAKTIKNYSLDTSRPQSYTSIAKSDSLTDELKTTTQISDTRSVTENSAASFIKNIPSSFYSLFKRTVPEILLFNSGTFWLAFIVFILFFALIRKKKILMMLYVLAFSLLFYYLTNGITFLILPFTALCDYLLARLIFSAKNIKIKKLFLCISLVMSLGILVFFKYTNFLILSFNDIFNNNFHLIDIFLPVGISFYTFQTVSYVVDVYKGRLEPTKSFLQYIFYLSFFPLILAGPIVRAKNFFPQIKDNKYISNRMIYTGLWLIILGLVKKAIFADYISQFNNWVFDSPLSYSGFEGLMAVIGYTAQIYCDFSGYSDMSIGLAMIMGFNLGVNFNFPYKSRNLSEFWRRWHISLSSWMRDYIYIPLGGNKKGKFMTYLNNFLTMLIAGIWHGASYMFIVWGAMHGVGLIIQKINKPWLDKIPNKWYFNIFFQILTFAFVAFLWIFFRGNNMTVCFDLIRNICTNFDFAYLVPFFQVRTMWCVFIILIYLFHALPESFWNKSKMLFIKSHWTIKALILLIVIQLIIQFSTGEIQPFIYSKF